MFSNGFSLQKGKRLFSKNSTTFFKENDLAASPTSTSLQKPVNRTSINPWMALTHPTTSDTWITLDNKEAIKAHLIAHNNTHYRQANPTPFENTERGRHLGYHGTNAIADSILDGTYSF